MNLPIQQVKSLMMTMSDINMSLHKIGLWFEGVVHRCSSDQCHSSLVRRTISLNSSSVQMQLFFE